MQIQIERLDITQQVAERQQPVIMLKRELPGNDGLRRIVPAAAKITNREPWWILQHRLPGNGPHWAIDVGSTHVRIPMFDYLLPDPSIETLVHFGAQTGALATALIPADKKVQKLFVAIGNVFQRPDGKPGFQTWIGYAICLEKE